MKIHKTPYYRQAELLLQILPFVMRYDCFALKGGSALNFFVRDLPRLSIDIDLTYMPIEARDETIRNISDSLKRIAEMINGSFRDIKTIPRKPSNSDLWNGIIFQMEGLPIKIEPNLIIRGSVFPCETRKLAPSAEKAFEMSMMI